MKQINIDNAFQAYIDCALWSSCDDNGNPLDDNYRDWDMSPDTLEQMKSDVIDFIDSNHDALITSGLSDNQTGHDFWLTRNGHGAGFWDRGLGSIGELLTDAARVYGSVDLYVGEDGVIYA